MLCRKCGAIDKQPCRDASGRIRRSGFHIQRLRDIYRSNLAQRRQVREDYLSDWLQQHGDIFKES